MEKKSGVTLVLALAVIAFLVFGGTPAVADESESQTEATAASTTEPEAGDIPVSVAGMTVWIDEETGQLRTPTAEEAAELTAAMQRMFGRPTRSAEPFAQTVRPDGAVVVDLGLSQLDFSVATVDSDGEVSFKCLDTAHEAQAHVHNQVETPEEK